MEGVYEFVANTADGAVAIDEHQTVVLWNGSAKAILGQGSSEVVGRKCFEVVRGRDADGCPFCRSGCEMFRAASHLEAPPTMELSTTRTDGTEVWLSVSSIVVPSRRNGLSVLVHLFREVTRGHELARAVRDLAKLVSGDAPPPHASHPNGGGGPVVAVELTQREREILAQLAAGHSTGVIAESLFLSEHTVRNHVASVLAKLGVHSRLEAATYAIRSGLVAR